MVNVPDQSEPVAYCLECFDGAFQTTVYEYGCLPERLGGYGGTEIAMDQMRAMVGLWNELVSIELHSREEYRHLTADVTIESLITPLDAEEARLRSAIADLKKLERKKKITIPPVISDELKAVRSKLKPLRDQLKAARSTMKLQNGGELVKLKADIDAAIKKVFEASPLLHTNRNWLYERFKGSSSRAMNKADGSMLNFKRFDGTGSVFVPFTNGLSVSNAQKWEDDRGFFQIGHSTPHRQGKESATCRIRVASNANRKPIWLTIPVVFHRPLPGGRTSEK